MFNHDDIVYMAGIIDGEGCLSIEIQNPRKNRKTDYYAVRLVIVNTNRDLIDWLLLTFGGKNHTKKDVPGRKTCYSWRIFSFNASAILEACLPYMRVKKLQAQIIIDFMRTKERQNWFVTEEVQTKRRSLYEQIRSLNKVGA